MTLQRTYVGRRDKCDLDGIASGVVKYESDYLSTNEPDQVTPVRMEVGWTEGTGYLEKDFIF